MSGSLWVNKMNERNKGNRLTKYVPDYVVFDLETTGINPVSDDIIEISALKVVNGKIVEEFSSLINPGRPIPYQATKVNHITDKMDGKRSHICGPVSTCSPLTWQGL